MKRSNTQATLNHANLTVYKRRLAYHEAGHAAAIHLNNRLKKLPPVFYKIELDYLGSDPANMPMAAKSDPHECIGRINGGRLIQSLPLKDNELNLKPAEDADAIMFRFTHEFHPAFEADIVNLLAGPLAEAKFVALMDGEPFDYQLLSVQALKNYGGEDDLVAVYDYLHSYSAEQQVRDESLAHFLRLAFDFVNNTSNWQAIARLAHFILTGPASEISCEQAAVLLDS